MLGRRTSPRRWQEHLSGKLKNAELDICTGVHVDDMLAVGSSELTKNLLQELSKDMTMRWRMVTRKSNTLNFERLLGRLL